MNPLIEAFDTPFETAPFDKIKPEHYLPAIKQAIEEAKEEVNELKKVDQPTFENIIVGLERTGKKLSTITSVFFNINSAETNEEIQQLAREISPLLTSHSNDILLDVELFALIEYVFSQAKTYDLSEEEKTLLEKTYKSFVRNGAKLNGSEKTKLREIDKELSQLGLKFGENVLAETNAYSKLVENEQDLSGLPDAIMEAAAQKAEEKGYPGKWLIDLTYPSYIPFMTYADSRELRKELFFAYNTKGCKGDALDNQEIIKSMLRLKNERAHLLGYTSFADFVLEERMAESSPKVMEFIKSLLEIAIPKAQLELAELTEFASKLDGLQKLEKWDFAYYAEKLKKQKYEVDDELLRPYFKLDNVIQGVFTTAEKLFDIRFVQNNSIPKYHPDVITYEVQSNSGDHVAIFYADFYPREGKRNGAWMTSFKGQEITENDNKRPHVSIVCNFTKPTKTKPSLLTFNEVTTLFHEFGHALHGILANGKFESLSGTNVYWDFVELPSQLMENWCYEKECLDLFAKHFETGETLPEVLIKKIKKAANFQQGYQTVRQLGFSMLDMAYHGSDPTLITDIFEFEKKAMQATAILPDVEGTLMSTSFSHIFQGGYAAGYYSYKWAEVLDADAFEVFKENGIFDKKSAESLKHNILSAGGREHPSKLYERFRGRAPKPDALLKRAGMMK